MLDNIFGSTLETLNWHYFVCRILETKEILLIIPCPVSTKQHLRIWRLIHIPSQLSNLVQQSKTNKKKHFLCYYHRYFLLPKTLNQTGSYRRTYNMEQSERFLNISFRAKIIHLQPIGAKGWFHPTNQRPQIYLGKFLTSYQPMRRQ